MHSESRHLPSVFVFSSFNLLKFQCDPVLLAAWLGWVMSVQALLRSALLLPPQAVLPHAVCGCAASVLVLRLPGDGFPCSPVRVFFPSVASIFA